VEYEINDLLAWAPDSLTAKDRKAIRDEVMAQTRHVTDALTTEEPRRISTGPSSFRCPSTPLSGFRRWRVV
jgi:hypothetical protein